MGCHGGTEQGDMEICLVNVLPEKTIKVFLPITGSDLKNYTKRNT